jgi:hypothetical protein
MRQHFVKVVLLVTGSLSGCGDGSTSPGSARVFGGAFALTSVNGQPLPATLQPPSATITITLLSGTLSLTADGRHSFSSAWQETVSGTTTSLAADCPGTWTRRGNVFTLAETSSPTCGGSYTATWDGANRVIVDFAPSLQTVFDR